MKKSKYLVFAFAISLVFASCSSEDAHLVDTQSSSLLKTAVVKRDISGAYSLDFEVTENVKVQKTSDAIQNITNFNLYSTDLATQKTISENLSIDADQLKIGFVDVYGGEKNFTIFDDNIRVLSKTASAQKLEDYSLSSNEDGTYTLDFAVKNNVQVDFVYNEEDSEYEIHLKNGKNGEANFSRTFNIEEGEQLKIAFVNHSNSNAHAKTSTGDPIIGGDDGIPPIRKPVIIIDDGEDA